MKKLWWLVAAMLMWSCAAAEQVYYVNPEGGTRYHVVRDCPSISTKYHDGMVEVGASELKSDAYAELTECSVCKAEASVSEKQTGETDSTVVLPGDYVVGVDIPQGLYQFSGAGDQALLTVLKWDGTPLESYAGSDWSEVVHLYNEQRIRVSQGCEGRFMMKMNETMLDTGTRQLCITEPGAYWTYSDLNPGLYIVEALDAPSAPLRILNKADSRELRSFTLGPGASYTIFLGSSMVVDLPAGCRLRSFSAEMRFQSGEPESVAQARCLSGQQMPVGAYSLTALPGTEASYSVTTVYDDFQSARKIEANETVILDLMGYETEVFVELVNCSVIFHVGDNG